MFKVSKKISISELKKKKLFREYFILRYDSTWDTSFKNEGFEYFYNR